MKKYIGTKQVEAMPMTLGEYIAKTGKAIAEYPSQMDAVRQNKNLTQAGISKCCCDNSKTHRGYKFKFK